MPRQVFEYDPPQRFVVGTVGEPGSRTFFLQARSGARVTSVALEKQQVAALAERIEELLDEVVRRTGGTAAVPAVAPAELEDREPLEAPILEEFRVGTLALAWDTETEQLLLEARALSDDPAPGPGLGAGDDAADADAAGGGGDDPGDARADSSDDADDSDDSDEADDADDADDDSDLLRVRLPGAMARNFARRALAVVAAGRPPCPFCSLPLDAGGHICPRSNGYRR